MSDPRKGWAGALAATLVYAVAVPWVFRSWYLAADLIPHTPGAIGAMVDADLYLNIWILAWIAHAAMFAPTEILDGNIFHPALNTIAGSENMLAHVPFTAPVLAATGSALAMLKAYVLESFVLSGLGMYLYVYHHTRNFWAALVSGAAYTFTPFRVETIPQPQYLGMAGLPLAFLSVDLYLEKSRRRWLAAFAGALVLQALSCVYTGFFTFILCPAYVVSRAWMVAGHPRWIATTARLALAMIAAAVLLIPAALPYLQARGEGMIPTHDLSFIQAASWRPSLFFSDAFVARAGIVAIGMVAIGVLLRFATRRHAKAGASPTHPVPALWIVAGVATILAIGPFLPLGAVDVPMPYLALYEVVPGFSSIRVPIRFISMTAACLAALAGFALARILNGRARPVAGGVTVLLTGMAVFAAAPRPHPVVAANLSGEGAAVYEWLAAQPKTGAVLEIPGQSTEQDVIGNHRNGRYMIASTIHWRPLLNGYTAYPPPSAGFYSAAIRDLPNRRALELLVETSDLRWILVHRNELTPQEAARWPEKTPTGLEQVAEFGTTEVYQVTVVPKRNWRPQIVPRLAGARDTLYRTSTMPLPEPCRRGRLAVDAPKRIPPFPLARRVRVAVVNESPCVWPAVGLLENGLVGLDYRWIPPEGTPTVDQFEVPMFRLLSDVEPGSTEEGAIMLWPPKGEPGTWTLEVRLFQRGELEPLAVERHLVDVRAPKNTGRPGTARSPSFSTRRQAKKAAPEDPTSRSSRPRGKLRRHSDELSPLLKREKLPA